MNSLRVLSSKQSCSDQETQDGEDYLENMLSDFQRSKSKSSSKKSQPKHDNLQSAYSDLNNDIDAFETDLDVDDITFINEHSERLDIEQFKSINTDDICAHMTTNTCKGIETCSLCGIELYQELALDPEWRFYGSTDSRNKADPSRCFLRKIEEKTIFKDLHNLNLPRSIIEEANRLYSVVTTGKIQRGNTRKAIIFACIFNAYKYQGNPQCPEELQIKFVLSKKEISKGLNFFNLNIGKFKKPVYISAEHIIPKVMRLFSAKQYHIDQVQTLYMKIKDKSILLNRSNPRSTVSGLVYYYCRLIDKEVTSVRFSEIVGLSPITICRIAKIVSAMLQTQDVVKLN